MNTQILTASTTYLVVAVIAFIVGYIVGRIDSIYATLTGQKTSGGTFLMAASSDPSAAKKAAQKEAEARVAKVSIDSTTVVTPVKTDTMQKVSDVAIGSVTKQSDTLDASVSKLAQLKR